MRIPPAPPASSAAAPPPPLLRHRPSQLPLRSCRPSADPPPPPPLPMTAQPACMCGVGGCRCAGPPSPPPPPARPAPLLWAYSHTRRQGGRFAVGVDAGSAPGRKEESAGREERGGGRGARLAGCHCGIIGKGRRGERRGVRRAGGGPKVQAGRLRGPPTRCRRALRRRAVPTASRVSRAGGPSPKVSQGRRYVIPAGQGRCNQ